MSEGPRILVLSGPGGQRRRPVFEALAALGATTMVAELKLSARGALRYVASGANVTRIKNQIAEAAPDIVVFDDENDRAGLMAILRANTKPARPVVWFRGAVIGYNALSPIDRYLLRHNDLARLVVRSRAMLNHWVGSLEMRALLRYERLEFCPHVVDVHPAGSDELAAKRSEWGIAPDEIVIGTIANARPIKNVAFAVEAAARLKSDRPIRFLFIGAHDDRFRKRLEAAMPGRVTLPGPVPDAGRYAGVFDIFVSPTRRPGEGFGLSLVEAMACGVPVVATHFGGAGDIVDHGTTGILLPENGTSWRRALQRLVDEPELPARMGDAGRQRARDHYSVDAVARDLFRIIEDAIADHQSRG